MKKHLLKWGKSGNITKVSEVLRKQPPLPKNVILGKILGEAENQDTYIKPLPQKHTWEIWACATQ